MIALVLVGGEGTRLRPLTNETPKPMLPILGRPMIARIVEWLAGHGVDEVVFSLAYRADAFIAAFPDNTWAGARLSYATEPSPLDTAGAIRFAAEAAGVVGEELVVCNGDVLTDLDVSSMIAFHRRLGATATVAVAPVEDPSVFGVAVVEGDGRIASFVEKPPPGSAPSDLVNIGTYVLSPGLVATIPVGRRVSIEREIFPGLVAARSLYAFRSDPYWLDTGTPERYIAAQLHVLRDEGRALEIDGRAGAPGCFVGEGASVAGTLEGVCFLGAGAQVQAGAVVRDAVIGPGALIEEGARVASSVLLAHAVVGTGATVDTSVLGAGARVGARGVVRAGSVLGNGAVLGEGMLLDSARLPV